MVLMNLKRLTKRKTYRFIVIRTISRRTLKPLLQSLWMEIVCKPSVVFMTSTMKTLFGLVLIRFAASCFAASCFAASCFAASVDLSCFAASFFAASCFAALNFWSCRVSPRRCSPRWFFGVFRFTIQIFPLPKFFRFWALEICKNRVSFKLSAMFRDFFWRFQIYYSNFPLPNFFRFWALEFWNGSFKHSRISG